MYKCNLLLARVLRTDFPLGVLARLFFLERGLFLRFLGLLSLGNGVFATHDGWA